MKTKGVIAATICIGVMRANLAFAHDDPDGAVHNSPPGFPGCAAPADPAQCGKKSGLVPFHKDAIHTTLVWSDRDKNRCPKLLMWMRPSEYSPADYLNPTVPDAGFPGFSQKYLDRIQGTSRLTALDESGWSRWAPDRARENTQLVDVCGLQAKIDQGLFTKENIVDLVDADFQVTEPFFANAGFSKGLGYNLFCNGHVQGADGLIYQIGGHDKRGNNGIKKTNIFDAKTETWATRTLPCTRTGWAADPLGTIPPHCDPNNDDNTDPASFGDLGLRRWYPTAVTLPDGRILVLSGSDTVEGTTVPLVRQSIHEVWDPVTQTTTLLPNAQKTLQMYPRSFVVQTGPGVNDWKVCVVGEAVARTSLTAYDPYSYDGRTSCLDVLAALADPDRELSDTKHWTPMATAAAHHNSGAAVMKVIIRPDGTWAQQVWMAGGSRSAIVEVMDFSEATPAWHRHQDLNLAVTQNNAVMLPDGMFMVVGGNGSSADGNNLTFQLYDSLGARKDLVSSTVPRHDHSTLALMRDGKVWVMGGNRTDLLPDEIVDQSVPVMESYQPPYFFKGPQPKIEKAPKKLRYGHKFFIEAGSAEIISVSLIRTGPTTHNWSWGNRYVKLPFVEGRNGKLEVQAPPLPGLAVPGDYMLFIVSHDGVPSEGQYVQLGWSDDD
jgi:hypothetical protein